MEGPYFSSDLYMLNVTKLLARLEALSTSLGGIAWAGVAADPGIVRFDPTRRAASSRGGAGNARRARGVFDCLGPDAASPAAASSTAGGFTPRRPPRTGIVRSSRRRGACGHPRRPMSIHAPSCRRRSDATQRQATQVCIFGDKGYRTNHPCLQTPIGGALRTPQEKTFDKIMSRIRVPIEWTFGRIKDTFAGYDYKKKNRLWGTECTNDWLVSTLLINAHSCLYGNEVHMKYGIPPPQLDDYFGV